MASRLRKRYNAAGMLRGWQIRAGRCALRWTTRELARRAGLGVSTVWRLEASDDVPAATTTVLRKLLDAFASGGVTFPDGQTIRFAPAPEQRPANGSGDRQPPGARRRRGA